MAEGAESVKLDAADGSGGEEEENSHGNSDEHGEVTTTFKDLVRPLYNRWLAT